jgi:hypothetical protein
MNRKMTTPFFFRTGQGAETPLQTSGLTPQTPTEFPNLLTAETIKFRRADGAKKPLEYPLSVA